MEPENIVLEKEKHLQTTNFLGSMLVFGGVSLIESKKLFLLRVELAGETGRKALLPMKLVGGLAIFLGVN